MENYRSDSYAPNKKNQKNKPKKKDKDIMHCYSEKKNLHTFKYHSTKNNYLIKIHHLEKSSNNNITSLNSNYRKDLSEIFSLFLNKKKFKMSNHYDEKHSKKFLDKKNKCLEKIILSDVIENDKDKNNKKNSLYDITKIKFKTQKSLNKYYIIITNYDEEVKNTNKSKC